MGKLLASGTYLHGVQVWEMTTSSPHWVGRAQPTWIRHVAWSPDGTRLVGGGDDGHVYVWDASDGTLLSGCGTSWGRHERGLEPRWHAAGQWRQWQRQWGDLRVGCAQRGACASLEGHPGVVSAVAWSPSGELLVSGGSDGMLRWWDVQSGECVRVREAHQGTVQALKVSPDGSRLASCGDDGAIQLWDFESGEHLRTLRRDRPYERLNITGVKGLTDAQRATLLALGAIEKATTSR